MSRHDTLTNTILQGRVDGTRKIGLPKGIRWTTSMSGPVFSTRSLFANIMI